MSHFLFFYCASHTCRLSVFLNQAIPYVSSFVCLVLPLSWLFIPYMSSLGNCCSFLLIPYMSYSSHTCRLSFFGSSQICPSNSVFHPIRVVLHPIYVAFKSPYIKDFKNLYNTYYTNRTSKAVWLC